MHILPAIDLLNGEAVRLYKGDYSQKTVYGDPVLIAQKFKDMGAYYLHIVDLDGAKEGSPRNFPVIEKISQILPIQIGGGIRTADTVSQYLKIADRVILGTVAANTPDFVAKMLAIHGPNRIAVGVDARNNKVSTGGWLKDSNTDYLAYIDNLKELGVETIIVTDISKDGTLTAPNWDMYKKIKDINIIVSGGVSCDEDVLKARDYYGVIVGKAYYEGRVNLEWLLKNA